MIRFATEEDAQALLAIYAYYIDTEITFEYELPTEAEFRKRIRFSHSLCSQNHAFSRITGISLLKKYRSTVRSDTFLLVLIIQTCTLCHKRTHICIRYFDMLRMCRIRFDIFRFFKRCHKRHIMRA